MFNIVKGADNSWEEIDIDNMEVAISVDSLDKDVQVLNIVIFTILQGCC